MDNSGAGRQNLSVDSQRVGMQPIGFEASRMQMMQNPNMYQQQMQFQQQVLRQRQMLQQQQQQMLRQPQMQAVEQNFNPNNTYAPNFQGANVEVVRNPQASVEQDRIERHFEMVDNSEIDFVDENGQEFAPNAEQMSATAEIAPSPVESVVEQSDDDRLLVDARAAVEGIKIVPDGENKKYVSAAVSFVSKLPPHEMVEALNEYRWGFMKHAFNRKKGDGLTGKAA